MSTSVNIATAKALVQTNAVTGAVIECMEDGRRWKIILRGRQDFTLKSERKKPKPFVTLETAIAEIKGLGLRTAQVDFEEWHSEQTTLPE